MSDAKKISPLAKKVLEVSTTLEINFSTIEVGLLCTFYPEKTSLYHSLMGEMVARRFAIYKRFATHRLSLFCWPVILAIIFGLNFLIIPKSIWKIRHTFWSF